ncbi:MAG: ABC transporter substrate-binding protein [Chlorobi bacterium]|nr:ABC transporter substrate-binding protein [Chlorobiota bacterium]
MICRTLCTIVMTLILLCQQGCSSKPSESKRISIVTSIEPLAYFAERIGGDHVSVSVMVPPGGNPHSYEPTPRQMTALSVATLFVKAGSGVEFELDWMPRFLSLNPGLRICDASEHVKLLPAARQEEAHGHDEVGPDHRHGRNDPHFWLSPENGIRIARNIERALKEADPPHAEEYAANTAELVGELQALHRETAQRLSPLKNRRFLVFHPAWGYYAAAFGLEQIAAEEEGKTLTPRQLQRVIEIARTGGIRVVFVSPQFSKVQAESIARDIGGVTITVDPLARDYQENFRKATTAFLQAMQ